MKKIWLSSILLAFGASAFAQHLMQVPDTISGTLFNLNLHKDSVQFKPGAITQTFGINGRHYLGPTLIMRKGDSVSITVNNQIGDTTTMHWHGFHVAPANDGGPYSMIMDGDSWNPKFVVRNRASTYWYHPHMMMKTAEQAIKGDIGFIIVRDDKEAALNIPRRYGVDDFPIAVQSVELDSQNQFMPKGMVDSIILVNGTDTPYTNMPAQVVRMRLLNASGERCFNFGFSGSKHFKIIGNDGGLLTAPVDTDRVWLSPGERAEVLLDLDGMNGQTIYLKSYASQLPMDVQGGPTMPMPSGPPMNSPLNGVDFNILQINVGPQTAAPVTTIPTTLVSDTPYTEVTANGHRTIKMSADSMMVMDGPFYFNDKSFDMDRIDYRIPLNNVEVWTLFDSTMVAHPFHIHDVHFYILDRNGVAPTAAESGPKDVVLVRSMETVRVIAKFEDFADTTIPYMYHCHILMHEDDGMMGQFKVGTSYTNVSSVTKDNLTLSIYPNPASSQVNISLQGIGSAKAKVLVFDVLGRQVFSNSFENKTTIGTAHWPAGVYIAVVQQSTTILRKSFVISQ